MGSEEDVSSEKGRSQLVFCCSARKETVVLDLREQIEGLLTVYLDFYGVARPAFGLIGSV